MLLAKTEDERRYHNLTYLICNMRQDGVTVRPLRQITGESEFNEVFFDGAFVPDDNIIGAAGGGWMVAVATLMFERPGLGAASALGIRMQLGELADLIRERNLHTDTAVRRRFAKLVAETEKELEVHLQKLGEEAAQEADVPGLRPWAKEGSPGYRFNWDSPVVLSRHDPDVIYVGGNHVFRPPS